MRCDGCGMDIPAGHRTCPYCGSLLAVETVCARQAETMSAEAGGELVFENNIDGVLEIKTPYGSGSGFLISQAGYALTNTHVIAAPDFSASKNIKVRVNGKSALAQVVKMGDDRGGGGSGIDLAVIKLSSMPAGAKALQFDDSDKVRCGERAFAIGNSQGDGTCITSGIVSDKARVFCGKTYIMSDCAINPGNSGGPLLNADGKVIGVNVLARLASQGVLADGMKYAIPANEAKKFAAKYLTE